MHYAQSCSVDLALTPMYAPRVEEQDGAQNRWRQTPWWAWILIILFPVVLHPWWLAIISIAAFILFVLFILGPLRNRNSHSD
jgi:hypothetical protein